MALLTALAMTLSCSALANKYTDGNDASGAADGASLEDRARAYWKALEAGDLVSAYEYEEANATGELTLQQYVRGGGRISFRRADLVSARVVEDGTGLARIEAESIIQGLPDPMLSKFDDRWVQIDGRWYHSPRLNRSAKRLAY